MRPRIHFWSSQEESQSLLQYQWSKTPLLPQIRSETMQLPLAEEEVLAVVVAIVPAETVPLAEEPIEEQREVVAVAVEAVSANLIASLALAVLRMRARRETMERVTGANLETLRWKPLWTMRQE